MRYREMKSFIGCFIVVLALCQNVFAEGLKLGERVVSPINGHEYFLTSSLMTRLDAEEFAVSQGGHLVTIRSQEENDWISETFSGFNLYIGLYQDVNGVEPNEGWSWISGEPITFTNWYPKRPDNNAKNEDCGMLFVSFDGDWNDFSCDIKKYHGLVEISTEEPTPLPTETSTPTETPIVTSIFTPTATCPMPNFPGLIQNPVNGHFYGLTPGMNWLEAEEYAVSCGGHLATLNDAGEESWIKDVFDIGDQLWYIGLYQLNSDGNEPAGGWVWISGEPVTYTNWHGDNQNDWQGAEDYSEMNFGGGWNDIDLRYDFRGVMEIIPCNPIPTLTPTPVLPWVNNPANSHCYVVPSRMT